MPDLWMDVDVNLAEVPVNLLPLIGDTDFKTIDADVNYNVAGLALIWNFTTTAGAYSQTAVTPTDTGGNYDWVEQGNGMFTIEIPASGGASINNDTEGFGWFTGVATGILPWRGPVIGFRAAGLNNVLIDSAYSATRGLAGTALPDAVADAAGGLPISDAGGLDLDTFLGRLTGNVALASVLGALNDAAADGDPTATDTVIAYIKQLINVLIGTAGIATFPASAAPGNAVSLAEAISQIYDEVAGLNGGALLDAGGVRTAVGLASANLDTQLDALPTAAENSTAVWGAATKVLTAGTNIVLAKGVGVTGFNDLSAGDVRTAVGLGSANLDTQLDALPTATENATALLKLDWTGLTGEAARSMLNALRAIRNKVSVATNTLTVTKEDDTTAAWTAAVTVDAAASHIVGIDPA